MLSAGKKILFCTYSSHRADSLRREVPAQLLNNAVFLLFPLLLLLLLLISPLSSATIFLLTLFTFTALLIIYIYIFVTLITCKYSKTTFTDHEMFAS